MLQGKEKGDLTPESGDEPAGSQSDDRIADGLYQVTLSNIPGSGSEFRFKISYEKGCCSILGADSRLFAVQEITTIESAAGKNEKKNEESLSSLLSRVSLCRAFRSGTRARDLMTCLLISKPVSWDPPSRSRSRTES